MADFARYLPLSQRSRIDERGVTSDRREPTSTVLRSIAGALRRAGEAGWTARTDDEAPTVADAVAALVAGFDRPPARRALDSAQHALGMNGRSPEPDAPVEGPADAAAALEARAVTITDRPQPTRLVELDDAVVAAVRIGDALGHADRGAAARIGRRGAAPCRRRPDAHQGRHRRPQPACDGCRVDDRARTGPRRHRR